MRRLASFAAVVALAGIGRAQVTPSADPNLNAGRPVDPGVGTSPPGTSYLNDCVPPVTSCGPQWWVRGEPVFWSIGTGKLVELGLNAVNSDTFNGLLSATNKSYLDVGARLLGSDRTGYRLGIGG